MKPDLSRITTAPMMDATTGLLVRITNASATMLAGLPTSYRRLPNIEQLHLITNEAKGFLEAYSRAQQQDMGAGSSRNHRNVVRDGAGACGHSKPPCH